ncbi:carbon dioxide concentrating mechanism protein CcmN [Calothrix sp. NIES-2100]|uniref:transferase n=1 Tax=Calothrix sp. NIES-2100 TaxID=1954172 RepID=UPI000B62081B|nr:carbon dioxide concentrating mechanism protein CcmN [Calothrix sp. NIES-2100]
MSVPPLRLSNNFESYISGEVTIHPSAVLAPGVILQAALNSKIIIGPGVCIGMGSILQIHEGTLEIEAGANLGAGFLMVGQGKIGTNACIGSATTVFHCSVAPGQVIPPGSILGDSSRQIGATKPEPVTNNASNNPQAAREQKTLIGRQRNKSQSSNGEKTTSSTSVSAGIFLELQHQSSSESVPPTQEPDESPAVEENPALGASNLEAAVESQESNKPATESPNSFGNQIYGTGSIQRLLVTLFPHRQSLNEPISDDHSSEG